MSDVLVLDSTGYPVETVTWQDAVCTVLNERAFTLDEDTEMVIHSPSLSMPVPRVIQLRNYIAKATKQKVSFSRRNLILRDDCRCQYCGTLLSSNGSKENGYTLDHIVPRARGGVSSWLNLVLCCQPCNHKKGHQTLEQSGMRLLRVPKVPSAHDPKFNFNLKLKFVRPEWREYLNWTEKKDSWQYWNVELQP